MANLTAHDSRQIEEKAAGWEIRLSWYFAFFVISGFCGLVYEVVWVRLAMASFGATTALVSIVLSIFMAGLGLGSWLFGKLVCKVSGKIAASSLRLYAVAEFLIGSSALLVPAELTLGRGLMLHGSRWMAWQSWSYYTLSGLWLTIALLPWCTLLGSTYPLLMSVIRQTSPSASERAFSYLYLANVIGALVGTLASAFVLIEILGFRRTLLVGAGLNTLLAVLAFRLSTRIPWSEGKSSAMRTSVARPRLYGFRPWAVPLMLFTTGLVSMVAEVIWLREFTPYLGNFVYAFALIVGVYLLATILGARDYRRWATSHNPSESARTWAFLAVSALIPLIGASPRFNLAPPRMSGLALFSIVFFCALTGFLTPLLVDAWSGGEPDKAGTAYAFNVLGCIVGPLVASFGLEPWLGERWSSLVLSLPLFVIAGLCAFRKAADEEHSSHSRGLRLSFVSAVGVAIVLFAISNDFETIYPVRQVRRDYAATVIAAGTDFHRSLLVNGSGMTQLNPVTKYIAHLPLASLNHAPKSGLVICFGMGTTFRSMLSWGIPTTSVDLIPSVPKLFPYFHNDAPQIVRSDLAEIVIDDGRRFLDGSDRKYDVIVVDPPPPVAVPVSSLLYSREFYQVIKRHLDPGGIFQSWYPSLVGDPATTASITKALVQSFPYVRAFRCYDGKFGIHYLASMEPIPKLDGSALAARLPEAAASDFVEWGPARNATDQFDLVLMNEVSTQELIAGSPNVPALSDDQPINKYFLLPDWLGISR